MFCNGSVELYVRPVYAESELRACEVFFDRFSSNSELIPLTSYVLVVHGRQIGLRIYEVGHFAVYASDHTLVVANDEGMYIADIPDLRNIEFVSLETPVVSTLLSPDASTLIFLTHLQAIGFFVRRRRLEILKDFGDIAYDLRWNESGFLWQYPSGEVVVVPWPMAE